MHNTKPNNTGQHGSLANLLHPSECLQTSCRQPPKLRRGQDGLQTGSSTGDLLQALHLGIQLLEGRHRAVREVPKELVAGGGQSTKGAWPKNIGQHQVSCEECLCISILKHLCIPLPTQCTTLLSFIFFANTVIRSTQGKTGVNLQENIPDSLGAPLTPTDW